MEHIVKLDENITYHLEKKKIKNMYIRVKNHEVFVTAPFLMPSYKVHEFVLSNRSSIIKALNRAEKKQNKLTLFGEEVTELQFNEFILSSAYLYILDRTRYFYSIMNIKKDMPSVKIKSIKTAYGVYHLKNNFITYNTEIFKNSKDIIDYVVIHELAHMKFMDHSKKFWDEVGIYCPNYKMLRKELKRGGFDE